MKQPVSLQIWQHPPAPRDRLFVAYGPKLYPTHQLTRWNGQQFMDIDRNQVVHENNILWWIEEDDYEGPPLNRKLREDGPKPETIQ